MNDALSLTTFSESCDRQSLLIISILIIFVLIISKDKNMHRFVFFPPLRLPVDYWHEITVRFKNIVFFFFFLSHTLFVPKWTLHKNKSNETQYSVLDNQMSFRIAIYNRCFSILCLNKGDRFPSSSNVRVPLNCTIRVEEGCL